MKRTKTSKKKKLTENPPVIPDAINCSVSSNFTQISNNILRNPELSAKAKGILCLLLSNQQGWRSHVSTITQMMADGETSIRSGLKELEQMGYLARIPYREKNTKIRRGTIWCYTDTPRTYDFKESDILEMLAKHGLEPIGAILRFSTCGSPTYGSPTYGKPQSNNIESNNTNFNNISLSKNFPNKEKNTDFLPFAKKLADIIQSNKNIKVSPTRLNNWANEIRKLSQIEGVEPARIETALDWYSENIGGQYIPVIESGAALRNKFTKLEDAMKRAGISSGSPHDKNLNGPSPKQLIKSHFNGLAPAFEKDCYFPAKKLLSEVNTRSSKARLVQALINLHEEIVREQEIYLSPEYRQLFPGAISLIRDYIEWIGKNDWIKDRSLNLFTFNHSLFTRFRRAEASKDNLERDPINGKSYLGG